VGEEHGVEVVAVLACCRGRGGRRARGQTLGFITTGCSLEKTTSQW
jgi:hypothetical protein